MKKDCIAYLAGIIEGEGYLKRYSYPRVFPNGNTYTNRGISLKVAMTDIDVIQKIGSIMSEFLVQPVKMRGPLANGEGCKSLYEVSIYGDRAYAIIVAIFDYLGKRRQKDAIDAIKLYTDTTPRKFKHVFK